MYIQMKLLAKTSQLEYTYIWVILINISWLQLFSVVPRFRSQIRCKWFFTLSKCFRNGECKLDVMLSIYVKHEYRDEKVAMRSNGRLGYVCAIERPLSATIFVTVELFPIEIFTFPVVVLYISLTYYNTISPMCTRSGISLSIHEALNNVLFINQY